MHDDKSDDLLVEMSWCDESIEIWFGGLRDALEEYQKSLESKSD